MDLNLSEKVLNFWIKLEENNFPGATKPEVRSRRVSIKGTHSNSSQGCEKYCVTHTNTIGSSLKLANG